MELRVAVYNEQRPSPTKDVTFIRPAKPFVQLGFALLTWLLGPSWELPTVFSPHWDILAQPLPWTCSSKLKK